MSDVVIFSNLLVIGPGLIGASLALAAKRAGVVNHVLGYARQLVTAQEAKNVGALDQIVTELSAEALSQACSGLDHQRIDAVFIAVPVGQFASVLAKVADVFADQDDKPVIWDAGSTKGDTAAALTKQAAQTPWMLDHFVLCHPIAGRERHGPTAADPDLFVDRSVIICPLDGGADSFDDSVERPIKTSSMSRVMQCWQAIGAIIRPLSVSEHDQLFAAVSHLPHALAFTYVAGLLAQSDGKKWMAEGGGGFRDFTRIAASSPEMWVDIFLANQREMLAQLRSFDQAFKQLFGLIETADKEKLLALLEPVAEFRSTWKS